MPQDMGINFFLDPRQPSVMFDKPLQRPGPDPLSTLPDKESVPSIVFKGSPCS